MKTVLITGALGGIGSELVKEFKKRNHKVLGIDLATENQLEELDAYFSCDLANIEKQLDVLTEIHQNHEVDIVIHNAGVVNIESFAIEGIEKFMQVMEINFHSIVRSTSFWLEKMQERENSSIVNMGSMAGIIPPAGMCSYSASKHALVGFTQSLQKELKTLESPIHIGLITPGFIDTPLMKVGEDGGFPKALDFLAISPQKIAGKIVSDILAKKEHIIPDTSGKVMKALNQFSPQLLSAANTFISRKIYKK